MTLLLVPAALFLGICIGAYVVAISSGQRIARFYRGMAALSRGVAELPDFEGEPTLEDWKALGRAQGQLIAYTRIADLAEQVWSQ